MILPDRTLLEQKQSLAWAANHVHVRLQPFQRNIFCISPSLHIMIHSCCRYWARLKVSLECSEVGGSRSHGQPFRQLQPQEVVQQMCLWLVCLAGSSLSDVGMLSIKMAGCVASTQSSSEPDSFTLLALSFCACFSMCISYPSSLSKTCCALP
ncbi:hypothetical protein WG66_001300 [Moniliophthora roreri]|nr:hypothetical protein WG66_001300 [Moniliophthora roreri]